MRKYSISLLLFFALVIAYLTCTSEFPVVLKQTQSLFVPIASAQTRNDALDVRLPLQQQSVRFAVIGDSGTGDKPQYEVA